MVDVTASYSPKHFLLKIQSIYIIIKPAPCWQQDSLLLTGPGIYLQTFHRNSCPAVLFFKVVGLFQIPQKEWLFLSLMTTRCSWGWSHNVALQEGVLHPPKTAFLSPSSWPRREHIGAFSWKANLLICFENYLGAPYSHRQSRNSTMNTFVIANITPTCKR